MDKGIYLANKKKGQLVSDLIKNFRDKHPMLAKEKIGHLGTLDPMASGLMVLLVGKQTKTFLEYQKLPKTYEVKAVFGIKTDSYDLLGIPNIVNIRDKVGLEQLEEAASQFKGRISQTPPPYSAIRIKGKPLYWWHKNKKEKEIDIKPRIREVYAIKIKRLYTLAASDLANETKYIEHLRGDFRQNNILSSWAELLSQISDQTFQAADLAIECSSGTYIRSIINDIGIKLGSGAFALDITRTKIGSYQSTTCSKQWALNHIEKT